MGGRRWVVAVVAMTGLAAACGSSAVSAGGGPTSSSATTAATTATTPAPATTISTATSVGAVSTVAGQATTVVADCGSSAFQPARIVVTCPEAAVVATEIHWTTWSVTGAVGTSVVEVNPCQPTCAAQSAKPFNGRLALSGPVGTSQGPRFGRLTITWTGSTPYGQASNSYALTTTTPA